MQESRHGSLWEAEAAVAAALEEFGRLDILVNYAGLGDLAAIEDTSLEVYIDWRWGQRLSAAGFRRGRGAAHRVAQKEVGPVPTYGEQLGGLVPAGEQFQSGYQPGPAGPRGRPALGRW